MLKISKLADYATVVLDYLNQQREQLHSAAQIAKATGLGLPTVSKLLKLLLDRGWLRTLRGSQGGYQLIVDANDISLADIIEAVDGGVQLTSCADKNSCCQVQDDCRLQRNWQYINKTVLNVLKSISLAKMAEDLSCQPITLISRKIQVK